MNMKDDRLRLLRTKYNYKNFDEESGTCEGVHFYPAAKEELNDFGGFPQISDKIFKAVCYVYNESKTGKIDDDICKSLYFWLGNTLINNLNKTELFSEVIIKLFERLNEYENGKICKIPHISMHENDFQKIKLIFDYSQDYVNYSLDLATFYRPCNEKYKNQLTTYVDNYKQLYKECKLKNQTHSYCAEFLKYYDAKKHDDLYYWSCNLTETLPEVDPLEGEDENEEQKAKLNVNYGRGDVQQPLQKTYEGVQEHEVNPDPLSRHPKNPENTIVSITSDDTPPSITSKAITGAVSVAGALVPSYLLYNVISTMINKYNALLHYIS
ncbi:hypothetical protein PVNG_05981 [Plasmodium vivax North Korean]|uniref:Variable surface protein Vir7-like protein n=1 Tax=Plasmodium vivax North Korean TaxID=1035514 RepID=A0A0J9W695_PLAVI|nr:hypothetical protein PVNG_05981 [Plasmodium vivax North Korean]